MKVLYAQDASIDPYKLRLVNKARQIEGLHPLSEAEVKAMSSEEFEDELRFAERTQRGKPGFKA